MSKPPFRSITSVHLLVVLAFLVGFALRTYHLDSKNLWVDEAHPWWFATLPIVESISLGLSGGPINSGADPLYNVLLHFWIELSGQSLYGLRYLSVITNLIGMAYLGRIAFHLWDVKGRTVSVWIGAIAPIWIFYSQEMRPYAFTPALMLVMIDAVISLKMTGDRKWWPWISLAVGEILSFYAHGFMVLAIVGVNVWIGVLLIRQWGKSGFPIWLRRWITSQFIALVGVLPLIPINLARSAGIRNPFVAPLSLPEFANMLWSYLMGVPWENVFDPIPVRLFVALSLILLLIGLALRLLRPDARPLADLCWLFIGISVLCLFYSWRDPSFHPRYAIFLTAPLFLILGGLLSHGWGNNSAPRWLALGLSLSLAVTAFISVGDLYGGSYRGYRHASTRVVAETLKSKFGPDDVVIIVAPHDFTLDYYGTGPAPRIWARFDEGIDTPETVLGTLTVTGKIGVLRNTNEQSDTRKILPFYLERYGSLVRIDYFEGYELDTYHLTPDTIPHMARVDAALHNWEAFSLVGVSIDSGDAVTVALKWQTNPQFLPDIRYAVSARLVDPLTGWQVAGGDALLLSERGQPTDWWPSGSTAISQTTQYFTVPLQPGTPPIDAQLVVTLYDFSNGTVFDALDEMGAPAGQQVVLDTVKLGPAPDIWAYPDERKLWRLIPLDSQIVSGYVVDKPEIAPGASLGLTIGWQVPPAVLAQSHVTVRIMQGDNVIGEDVGPPLQGRSPAKVDPTQAWLDRRLLQISPAARPGPAQLIVSYAGQNIVLDPIEIAGVVHQTEKPPVENPLETVFGGKFKLIGYKLDAHPPVTDQSVVTITLYWQALSNGAPADNFKVFTQILADNGQLVGQHDSIPVFENRPFSGWLTGEYIVDVHPMTFNTAYAGPARIQIGIYDPVTFQRLLTDAGKDAALLPIELAVEPDS